ncbi:hypothetical protein [Persicirhabdus sediminis]|uniref:Uncharacterized protein n=1 Tax=Persicirhabdus sediminis TaxID=454144 RepID=A0A8J7ME59_9BACT|nr:hypothetical protein [Persicirhabdus sediminis]MBK1791045.1 hypothetical protein [Persicirhabdus sediminis]
MSAKNYLLIPIFPIALAGLVSSCSSSSNPVAKLLPSQVPIVEVRADDLEEIKTGKQRYLAWNSRHKRYSQYSSESELIAPAIFTPLPPVPDSGFEYSGGLLPPLHSDELSAAPDTE